MLMACAAMTAERVPRSSRSASIHCWPNSKALVAAIKADDVRHESRRAHLQEQTQRKLFSRLDSGQYTKKLEQMLEARGVDLKDVQSRLNFKQVELTA